MKLSIACVTQAAPKTRPFLWQLACLARNLDAEFVIGAHGASARMYAESLNLEPVDVQGTHLEAMLDPVLARCEGDFILRLDDDERVTPAMERWLLDGAYRTKDSWFFPRFAMWPDEHHVIVSMPAFPDFQGRLTTRNKARRPTKVHAGSPYPAFRAPVAFEHHAFLVKTKEERREITAKYETLRTGTYCDPKTVDVVYPEDWKAIETRPLADEAQLLALAEKYVWWRENGVAIHGALKKELDQWLDENPNG